jgi:hypothetical protein
MLLILKAAHLNSELVCTWRLTVLILPLQLGFYGITTMTMPEPDWKLVQATINIISVGSAKANGREPKSCFLKFSTLSLVVFVLSVTAWHSKTHPNLELKTRPMFSPFSSPISPKLESGGLYQCTQALKNEVSNGMEHLKKCKQLLEYQQFTLT